MASRKRKHGGNAHGTRKAMNQSTRVNEFLFDCMKEGGRADLVVLSLANRMADPLAKSDDADETTGILVKALHHAYAQGVADALDTVRGRTLDETVVSDAFADESEGSVQ